jgi:hypothetical protein
MQNHLAATAQQVAYKALVVPPIGHQIQVHIVGPK